MFVPCADHCFWTGLLFSNKTCGATPAGFEPAIFSLEVPVNLLKSMGVAKFLHPKRRPKGGKLTRRSKCRVARQKVLKATVILGDRPTSAS